MMRLGRGLPVLLLWPGIASAESAASVPGPRAELRLVPCAAAPIEVAGGAYPPRVTQEPSEHPIGFNPKVMRGSGGNWTLLAEASGMECPLV